MSSRFAVSAYLAVSLTAFLVLACETDLPGRLNGLTDSGTGPGPEPTGTTPNPYEDELQVMALSPGHNATNIAPEVVVEIVFDGPIEAGTGNISLLDVVSSQAIEQAAVNDPRVSIEGATLRVDFDTTLGLAMRYSVFVDPQAIVGTDGREFTQFSKAGAWAFTTQSAGALALVSSFPQNGASDVPLSIDLSLTFNQNVIAGPTGNLTLFATETQTAVQTVSLSDVTRVVFSTTTLNVNLVEPLQYATDYHVTLDPGAVQSAQGMSFQGFSSERTFAFRTEAAPAVVLMSSTPADDAMNVDPAASLVLTFSAPITPGQGAVSLYTADGERVAQVPVEAAQVSDNTLTVVWPEPLAEDTDYYVLIDAGAVTSQLGAPFAGITDPEALSFSTAAEALEPIVLVETTPEADATGVSVATDLVFNFDADVRVGSGSVIVFETAGDVVFESVDVTASNVVVDGATVTVDLTETLYGDSEYYVVVTAGSFESVLGASFAGLAPAELSFSTEQTVELLELDPSHEATAIDLDANLVLTFSQDVELGEGDIVIRRNSDAVVIETISVPDPRVTLAGPVVTVDLDALLGGSTQYAVTLEGGVVVEAATGARFRGLSDEQWTFTTETASNPAGVGDGLVLWLDADYPASLKGDPEVRSWADRSPAHNDLRQTAADSRPLLLAEAINGRPAVMFDGADDWLSASTGLPLSAFEGFVVWRQGEVAAGSAERALLLNGNAFQIKQFAPGEGSFIESCTATTCDTASAWFSAPFVPTPATDEVYQWNFGFDAGTTNLFARSQGGFIVNQPAPTGNPAPPESALTLGGDPELCQDTDGCHLVGQVAEVLLYSRMLTSEERASLTEYLRAKWATEGPTCGSDELLGPDGSCYYRATTSASWEQARTQCQARGPGWDLATPRSAEVTTFLLSFLSADCWIGGTDAAVPGEWRWVTDTLQFWQGGSGGQAVNGAYANWTPSEPSQGEPEACARFVNVQGTWNDTDCASAYQFLCQGPGD